MSDPESVTESLVEMTFRWGDIERALPSWTRKDRFDPENRLPIGEELRTAIDEAFRVEALAESGVDDFGNSFNTYRYLLLFDVEDERARDGAALVRQETNLLAKVIAEEWGERPQRVGGKRTVEVRVCSAGVAAEGQICGRASGPPPTSHMDVTDVPIEKPESSVPLTERDGYWLTPIEVPFYDALRETGAIFAVQPWVQGVESRFRPDFMIFYDGGIVVVELDGHETHKSREQRTRDAKRQRWFEGRGIRVLRWTGSEVHANAQDCVREMLEIVRGKQARF